MKKSLLLFFLLLGSVVQAQSIIGEWKISELITYEVKDSYQLYKKELESNLRMLNFGNQITFNTDKTFKCRYTAPCGNDCFIYINGIYELVGEKAVKIIVKKEVKAKECRGIIEKEEVLGVYDIVVDEDKNINLIRRK